VAMRNRSLRLALTLSIFAGSYSYALAFVGQVIHDWSVTIPFVESRIGIVEWPNGTSTVFLGVTDFPLHCGAVTAVILVALCIGILLLAAKCVLLPKLKRTPG
jgi:hypothetical protein